MGGFASALGAVGKTVGKQVLKAGKTFADSMSKSSSKKQGEEEEKSDSGGVGRKIGTTTRKGVSNIRKRLNIKDKSSKGSPRKALNL